MSGARWALRQSPVFALVVLLTLGLYGLIGVVLVRPDLIGGFLGHETAGHVMGHFRFPHHRVHDLTFGFIVGTGVVGLFAQLRTPSRHVAGQLMALIPWVALLLAFVLAPLLGALTLVAAMLHPARRDYLPSLRAEGVNRVMLALVVIAAVPLLALASTHVGLQRALTSDHAALGHYGFMAAFSFTVIGVGLLACLRPTGWRLTAWVAGALPALLGLASLAYPNVDSRLGPGWALAAIAWGAGFVAAAERTRDAQDPTGVRPDHGPATSTPGTPRWAYVLGIVFIVLAVLFVILHVAGGGLRRHTPPSGVMEHSVDAPRRA